MLRKPAPKAYAAVPVGVSEEARLRILVQRYLEGVQEEAAAAGGDMEAMERCVADGVRAATVFEDRAATEGIATLVKQCPGEVEVRRREQQLRYVVRQYEEEIEEWAEVEKEMPELAAGGSENSRMILPPVPEGGDGMDALESEPPVVDSIEAFVLHACDANHQLKRLEEGNERASGIVKDVTKVINASVFDNAGLLDLNVSKIVAPPSARGAQARG